MIQQTVTLPDKDYQFFLEIVKQYQWKTEDIDKKTTDAQHEKDSFYLTKEEEKELSNRVENHLKNPSQVTPWEKVKEDIRKQL